jgi:serine/threonine-protein phosphatase 2A regulatory subunit A
MVRRAAASSLGKVAAVASPEEAKTAFLPLFTSLMTDEQDSVRLLAVEACIAFASLLPAEDAVSMIVPSLQSASRDKSWRVRYVVGDKYHDIEAAFAPDVIKLEVIPLLNRLLGDTEAEVRTQAVFRIPRVGERLPDSERATIIGTSVMPHIVEVCNDRYVYASVQFCPSQICLTFH